MMQQLPSDLICRFNVLLLEHFGRECPSMLDIQGLAKLDRLRRTTPDSFVERGEMLHTALGLLQAKNIDLDAVLDALLKAKQKKTRVQLNGYAIDLGRAFEDDRKKALVGLKNLRRFLVDCGYKNERDEAVLIKLSKVLQHQWPAPSRRARAGHQPEPWLKEARRELAAAKVPKEIREDLLDAAGLVPHRTI
jgi:hypothetical protein